jgi:hypothetical protein
MFKELSDFEIKEVFLLNLLKLSFCEQKKKNNFPRDKNCMIDRHWGTGFSLLKRRLTLARNCESR